MIFGQTTEKSSPVIINTPSSENKVQPPPELIGLTGQKAPDFTSANMNGAEYNLEDLRGKIVVINLWATYCPPCIEEMPKLNALVEKYQNKDVVFLAPTPDNKNLLEGFLQKTLLNTKSFPTRSVLFDNMHQRKS